jgi:hypothetical protein
MNPGRKGALLLFGGASLAMAVGMGVAFSRYPGGYDWMYTVISRLASVRRNPDGARWAAGAFLLTMVLLWPVTAFLRQAMGRAGILPRASARVLQAGVLAGGLLAVEALLEVRLSDHVRKGHEALALVAFLGFYGGVLGLYLHRIRERLSFLLPAAFVVLPLLAVGATQLLLYFDQRDLGWVDTGWRELGVPVWLSFAFWQWIAVAFLGLGIGVLVASGRDAPAGSEGEGA